MKPGVYLEGYFKQSQALLLVTYMSALQARKYREFRSVTDSPQY
jgi:hypothetical protein